MEAAVAKLRNVPIAPRKMRMVVDLVRKKPVFEALNMLEYTAKAGAPLVKKLLLSAVANWMAKNPEVAPEDADLRITEIKVDAGRTLKRFQPAPQGRAHRIRKRSNHVTIRVNGFNEAATAEVENQDANPEASAEATE